MSRRAGSIFKRSEPQEKRMFLNYLLQNPTVDGKKLEFTLRKPFNLVHELAVCPNWLPALDKFRLVNWAEVERELGYSGILVLVGGGHAV